MEKELKVIFTSDTHLGLKTDDIDRTEEIISILLDTVKQATKYKEQEYDVILVFGGDMFDNNNPSEKLISEFFKVLNEIKRHDIKTYYVVGNHESIADPDRLSCLSFLKEAKVGYPSITLVDDIKTAHIGQYDIGNVYFTFLPHITKAVLEKNHRNGKALDYDSVKGYIDFKANQISKKLGQGVTHYVFSHLNVIGAHAGSEENLLKKSEVYLPQIFTNPPVGYNKPVIVQAHIHTNQIIGNINIIGSPLYCGFGEKGRKYSADISISKSIGKKDTLNLIETNYRPFMQLEVSFIEETRDFFEVPEVQEFYIDLMNAKEKNPIVKFDITINPENNTYAWEEIRQKIMRLLKGVYVKPILPRVLSKKHVRSAQQKIGLTVKESVQVYIKKNLKKEPEKAKRIYNISKKYFMEA